MLDKKSLTILSEAINFCCSISLDGIIYDENNDSDILMEFCHYHTFEIQDIPDEITSDSRIELCREDDYEEDSCSKITVNEFIELYSV